MRSDVLKAGLLSAVFAVGAASAADLTVGSGSGSAGGTADVSITFTGDGATANQSTRIAYDSAFLDGVSCPAIAGPTAVLGDTGAGDQRAQCTSTCAAGTLPAGTDTCLNILIEDQSGFNTPLVNDTFGPITFNIAGGATGSTDLVILPFPDTDPVLGTATNGLVSVIVGPMGTLDLTSAANPLSVVAGATGTLDVTLTNSGTADLNVSACTATTTTAGAAVTMTGGAFAGTIAQGASDTATLTCDATGAAATDTVVVDLACDHDGSNAPTTTISGLTCNVVAAPPAQINVTPEPLALSGFIGGTVGGNLTVANTAAAGSDDLTGISCTYAGDAAITVAALSADPLTLAPGASETAAVSCDSAAVGSFAGTYTCASSVATTVNNISCDISDAPPPPEFIPTLSQWAMILMALVLAGFAGLTLYRREGFEA